MKKLSHYELTTILKPEGGMDAIRQFAERVDGIIAGMEGKIVNVKFWGEKKLAYEIKKNLKGNYVYFNFVADGPTIHEVERNLNIWEHVLKFMTIKLDNKANIEELLKSAEGIASLTDKEKKNVAPAIVEETAEEEKKEEVTVDNKAYNEKLQESLSNSEDDEDENVEL